MPQYPIWRGVKQKGKVVLKNLSQYNLYLCCFPEGKNVEVVVRPESKGNSRKQQNYFRGVIVPHIAKMLGISGEKAFGHLQVRFFTFYDENGIQYIKSTALNNWTTVEWEEKMQDIREWAFDEHEYLIPLPNEVDF